MILLRCNVCKAFRITSVSLDFFAGTTLRRGFTKVLNAKGIQNFLGLRRSAFLDGLHMVKSLFAVVASMPGVGGVIIMFGNGDIS